MYNKDLGVYELVNIQQPFILWIYFAFDDWYFDVYKENGADFYMIRVGYLSIHLEGIQEQKCK